jgi:GT2 family glycosyltransferase
MQPADAAPAVPIAYWPGWPELICSTLEAAIAQASWLAHAASVVEALVWMGAPPDPGCAALPVRQLQLEPPLTPAELRAELAGEPLQALADDRPTPPLETLFSWESPDVQQGTPRAAVLLSLFNYGDRIAGALNSVGAQSQPGLELIVVDDASSDDGAAVVQAWMQAQVAAGCHPLVRLQLLRHRENAGLATARNTAFRAAQAPWCFVLDADNALYPRAVAHCLQLAHLGSARLAVVHPLLAVEREPGRPDEQRSLVSTAAWQRQRFQGGNVVDAMALVRRSAWEAVGGYTHIEGGWEDFDFWCKLIEAGFHGVQCPELLAVYRSHADSMSHTATNRSWRTLSRTLQRRHPWLNLPLAR